jgi:protein MAK11
MLKMHEYVNAFCTRYFKSNNIVAAQYIRNRFSTYLSFLLFQAAGLHPIMLVFKAGSTEEQSHSGRINYSAMAVAENANIFRKTEKTLINSRTDSDSDSTLSEQREFSNMGKRKRNGNEETANTNGSSRNKKTRAAETIPEATESSPFSIQIIAGSYDRVLHGITAKVSADNVEFADTFLFNAHASAIRCLALSPPSAPVPGQSQKIILASGSTDERINLYHLSAHPPRKARKPIIPSLTSKAVAEDPRNRELGALHHHSSSITALYFPTRSKLLSSAEDSTVAVTRTRDWSLLSTIKAPIPKPQGRPSGDTAPPGGTPSGINDFAVHPSLKLMISVGKGEKCMRLWNLVTGKKAGVLSFGREMLSEIGEGRFGSGEGRKVAWGSTEAGEEFCVGFERGALVFGMDSKPKCKVMPQPKTKVHQLCYITTSDEDDTSVMAISTEDGRILFYSTSPEDLISTSAVEGKDNPLPSAKLIAYLGGKEAGISGRIKDFTILQTEEGKTGSLVIVGGSSDGSIRLWKLSSADLNSGGHKDAKQIGSLLGVYETGNRITCLRAFVMLQREEGDEHELEARISDMEESSSSDSD